MLERKAEHSRARERERESERATVFDRLIAAATIDSLSFLCTFSLALAERLYDLRTGEHLRLDCFDSVHFSDGIIG